MLTSMPIEFYKEGRDLVLTSFPFCSRDITCMSAWIKRKILDLINRGETWECEAYLLQQRALEEFNIFVSVLADIPSDWPRVRASDTPSILTAIAKLLQIFAAYSTKLCQRCKILWRKFDSHVQTTNRAKSAQGNLPPHFLLHHSILRFSPLRGTRVLQLDMHPQSHQPVWHAIFCSKVKYH